MKEKKLTTAEYRCKKLRSAQERTPLFCQKMQKLTAEEIVQSMQAEEAGESFLHEVFFWCRQIDSATRATVLNHANCPNEPLLFAQTYLPDRVGQDCAALAVRNLQFLDNDEDRWERQLTRYQETGFKEHVLQAKYFKAERGYDLPAQIFRSLPDELISAAISKIGSQQLPELFDGAEKRVAAVFVSHRNEACRLCAARLSTDTDHLKLLASDESLIVKKALAARAKLPADIYSKLRASGIASVVKLVEESVASQPIDSSLLQDLQKSVDKNSSVDVLVELANHPQPVVRYAAALHRKANQKVFDALMNGSSDWSRAPVGSRSRNPEHIRVLADSDDLDVLRHVADSRIMDEDIALSILEKTDDNEVRVALAARHLDSESVIAGIIETRSADTFWELSLKEALNPSTPGRRLRELYKLAPELCVSKAIARHPRCPKPLAEIFGTYLPKDLKNNPKYQLAFIEKLDFPHRDLYTDSALIKRLKDNTAQAHLSNSAARWLDSPVLRAAVVCDSVQAYSRDYIAVNGNPATLRKLAEFGSDKTGRFVAEILLCKSPAVRKQLAKRDDLPASVLERLRKDSDATVRAAARRSDSKKPTVQTSTGASAGGNKVQRLQLATSTRDSIALANLGADKLAPVRAAAAGNSYAPSDMLAGLLADTSSQVVIAALMTLRTQTLTADQSQSIQPMLEKIMHDERNAKNSQLLGAAIRMADAPIVEKAWRTGKLSGVIGSVALRVETRDLFDALLHEVRRSGQKPHWLANLAQFEGLTKQDAQWLLSNVGNPADVLVKLRCAELFIDLAQQHRCSWLEQSSICRAGFSQSQLQTLVQMDPSIAIVLGEQLALLPVETQQCTLTALKVTALCKMLHITVFEDRSLQALLFETCQQLDYSAEFNNPLADFMECQRPTDEQIAFAAEKGNAIVRSRMARNPAITGQILMDLALDASALVRECLFYRDELTDDIAEGETYVEHWGGSDLPGEMLIKLASDKDKHIRARARKLLSIRGANTTNVHSEETTPITNLLKRHDAPLSAVKANRKLVELGILEEVSSPSTSSKDRKSKQFSRAGRKYGVNKQSEYGIVPEYYVDLFPELLKKIA